MCQGPPVHCMADFEERRMPKSNLSLGLGSNLTTTQFLVRNFKCFCGDNCRGCMIILHKNVSNVLTRVRYVKCRSRVLMLTSKVPPCAGPTPEPRTLDNSYKI